MSSVFQHNPESVKRLIILIVEASHFFVLCLDVSIGAPKFIVRARFYDSSQRCTRQLKQCTMAAGIVSEVNTFFRYFVLQDKKYENMRMSDLQLLKVVESDECPSQTNGYNCGLFAVAMVLRLADGKEGNSQTFRQLDITKLRKKLAEVFASNYSVQESAGSKTESEIVCSCFPALRGTSIVYTFGVETIGTIVKSAATALAKTKDEGEVQEVWTATEGNFGRNSQRKTAEAKSVDDGDDFDVIDDGCLDDDDSDNSDNSDDSDNSDISDDSDNSDNSDDSDNGDNGDKNSDDSDDSVDGVNSDNDKDSDDSDKECEVHDSEDKEKERDKGNVSSMAGSISNKPESSLSENSEDTLLHSIMKEANVDCFPTLEDATPIIEAYPKFRLFRCREHIDCPFQILLSNRRSDGMFCVSRMNRRVASTSTCCRWAQLEEA